MCNDYIRTNLPYDFKFTYFSNRDQICLGSPIFLEKSSNIFGISSSFLNQKEQYGNYIGPIINSLKKDLNYGEQENEKYKYKGEFKNGKREGYGECNYKNGEFYQGGWINDKRQGKGRLYYKNEKYEGNFINGNYINDKSNEKKYSFEIGPNENENDDIDDDEILIDDPKLEEKLINIRKSYKRNKRNCILECCRQCWINNCKCMVCLICTAIVIIILLIVGLSDDNNFDYTIDYNYPDYPNGPYYPNYPKNNINFSFKEFDKNCKIRKDYKCLSCIDGYELIDGNCLSKMNK